MSKNNDTTTNNDISPLNWRNVSEIPSLDEFIGDYLEIKPDNWDIILSSYFIVGQPIDQKSNSNNTKILFFLDGKDIENHKPLLSIESNLDFNSSKKIVENTIDHFKTIDNYSLNQINEYIIQQIPEQTTRQLETAQKTGYVQGVCESVLAFNTDENRKIMSEDTMSFLSKKILSEMHVTKDMAQKFANPETYKALEKCVFAPAQEQQLEQTQSQGIGR